MSNRYWLLWQYGTTVWPSQGRSDDAWNEAKLMPLFQRSTSKKLYFELDSFSFIKTFVTGLVTQVATEILFILEMYLKHWQNAGNKSVPWLYRWQTSRHYIFVHSTQVVWYDTKTYCATHSSIWLSLFLSSRSRNSIGAANKYTCKKIFLDIFLQGQDKEFDIIREYIEVRWTEVDTGATRSMTLLCQAHICCHNNHVCHHNINKMINL